MGKLIVNLMKVLREEEIVFKKHYKSLCHFAWQMLHDVQAAEDVVQDAFMTYFCKKDTISSDERAIRQFLFTSVKFACYNITKREKVDAKYIDSLPKESYYDDETEFKIIKAEVLSEIYRIVETMPEACRKIFKMGYLEGLTVKEISEELNISVSTVKTQHQRALKVIKGRLNPEYYLIFLLAAGHM